MLDILMTDEEKSLRDEVVEFVKSVPSRLLREMDTTDIEYPYEYVRSAAAKKLLGLRFPPKWGGRGMSWTAEMIAIAEVTMLGASLGCLYSLPSIVGEGIYMFGTDEQKEKFLKPTIEGKLICAEALTEPRGGSDFFGATTTAKKSGSKYILNGQKRFIVGARGADYFLVYVRTREDAPGHESISVLIVETERGVRVEEVYGLMGTRGGGTGRIVFKDVEVPVENLIGEENHGAEIFNRMMIPERLTSAAGAVGLAKAALQVAVRYSDKRKAFGEKIRRFQAVSFKVADSITKLDAARSLVYAAARTVDDGNRDARRIVSEAKKFATETAWEVVNNAMQIMGGIGYTNVYPVERFLRDTRLAMIWTGTNEIMNLLIQHEFYKEALAAKDAERDVEHDAVGADKVEEKVYE
ncbi:MAG: acyl-CoA dehydrogenase family protein [bacterium]